MGLMDGWTQIQCSMCKGKCKLEVGRNEDNRLESVDKCDVCNGLGWLKVYRKEWSKPHNRIKW